MKLLMRAPDLVTAHHWVNVLRSAGIRCELRNTALAGALGEIPFLEAAPQLWVNDVFDEHRARLVLDDVQRAVTGAAWRCAKCAETLEPQFGTCWRCGGERAA
ncbi:MAG TPA: DUF2007 domain-containing protein [Burkholderiaceae bacterium]|nr:DUF2007 domain-containing protein [Burkholderiaceae bacterium]